MMRYPYRVHLVGNRLYVSDLHGPEYFCHMFEYPSMKYLQSFAGRGQAPNETTDVGNFIVNNNDTVYLLNIFERKIYRYDGNQLQMATHFSEEIVSYQDFAQYNDSVFIIADYSGKDRLTFVNTRGEIVRRLGTIQNKEHSCDNSDISLGSMWRAFLSYNPRNGIAALVTQLGEVLEVYDLKNDKVTITVGETGEPECTYRDGRPIPKQMGYGDVCVGEKYIYAVFWGHNIEEMKRTNNTLQGGEFIHVFDLQGTPVKRFHLDCMITGLFVDEKTGNAIGTDVNEEKLVLFSLN